MGAEIKKWRIKYDHHDGRAGTVEVTTEVRKLEGFQYGNGKSGALTENGILWGYDLRYNKEKDLHMAMLKDYFGAGMIEAVEIPAG